VKTFTQKKTPPFPAGFVNLLDEAGEIAQRRVVGSVRFKEEFKRQKNFGGMLTTESRSRLPIQ
jgi:hypothetical protein